MASPRGEFGSKFGFLMAAAGSAVGLANVWGFPTQVASNGGAAFLIVYLVMAFLLAYPALMAELVIGRHAKANSVTALSSIASSPGIAKIGATVGVVGVITACLIFGFYGIVAGWMASHALSSAADIVGLAGASEWLASDSQVRSFAFAALFMVVTVSIICGGVQAGIEKWCERLMPSLVVILVGLIIYVLTLDGAMEGVRAYLVPDFGRAMSPDLVVSAMGQAFFSMSLGVGTMLVYGSYVKDDANIESLGRSVTLLDIGIAVTAGMLIIPAMYVALNNGVQIFDEQGVLIESGRLIFAVLPALFDTMGAAGPFVSFAFFVFMSVAALTSTISILEVPVAYAVENRSMQRKRAAITVGLMIFALSVAIIIAGDALFNLVVVVATQYSQPLLGLMMCVFAGWVLSRNALVEEIRKCGPNAENNLFWKIWPLYVRFVCPAAILLVFLNTIIG